METEAMIFSRRLNFYMNRAGKDQIDLIRELGVNRSTISTWCNGNMLPRLATIKTLAGYFGVTTTDLLGETFTEPSPEHEEFAHMIRQLNPHEILRVRDFVCGIFAGR